MAGAVYYALFFVLGIGAVRCLLPRMQLVKRIYIGVSLGWLMLLWLPALWACLLRFSWAAHGAALATGAVGWLCCFLLRDRRSARPWGKEDRRLLKGLLITALPLTLLGIYLEYTHTLCPGGDGNYYVGQSTYGDLQLHLSIASYGVGAKFPLQNNLLAGELLVYPYLSDTCASTLLLMGMPLASSMVVSGSIMLALVFSGFYLFAAHICRQRGAAALAFFLLFVNGGLGFFYVLDGTVENGTITGIGEKLQQVMEGYYQTPTNQPDPHNLRWVNMICDMFIPQRGILGGWTLLLPALNLLGEPLCPRSLSSQEGEAPSRPLTPWILAGLFGGGLPLVHTHSYLALVLASAGMCLYGFITAGRGRRWAFLRPWLVYGGIAAALSLPQLLGFTFRQTAGSDHFIRLWFNWVNNRNGDGQLVDNYLWFYIKNIGVAYVLILLALLKRMPRQLGEEALSVRNQRLLAVGAFTIYLVAELVRFQPNVYDNNKLFYVWFLLCLPFGAEYAVRAWHKLAGLPGRRVLGALFLVLCFTSGGLSIARECVSRYQAYTGADMAAAEFVKANTEGDDLFLTGTQHLNPVSSLAGRPIYCGPDLYLYWHGYSTGDRQREVAQFYEEPEKYASFPESKGIRYIYVSSWERSSYSVDEEGLSRLYPLVYEGEDSTRIWQVSEE